MPRLRRVGATRGRRGLSLQRGLGVRRNLLRMPGIERRFALSGARLRGFPLCRASPSVCGVAVSDSARRVRASASIFAAKLVDGDAVALHPAVDLHARFAELPSDGRDVALVRLE